MIVKGIISSVDRANKTAEVILQEYDGVVTRQIPFYNATNYSKTSIDNVIENIQVGQFVMVVVFNNDFNDCMILL